MMKKITSLEDMPRYEPEEGEVYMNDKQLEHFRNKLTVWKRTIQDEMAEMLRTMKEETDQLTDSLDRASREHNHSVELRTKDRECKLIKKIDEALVRIKLGGYGYCRITGDEIGLDRLDVRPTSDLSIDSKIRLEAREKTYERPRSR